ncbi:probable cytosolic iron-sulfur protein assembly protein CIAO1 [Nematostella vectensis]|uniref:probable cytosolic iron-sulfur protein assembly protein CIAO1 n=1 Tax=Nematostella vectensis TaxID=45351 RepID=UPI0020777D88|nr:probable cytosolic iron-sulfur protein assembly protein CIAO1 [Nematostella vectensis]
MDREKVHKLISQFLHEQGYLKSLSAFQEESGFEFKEDSIKKSGELLSVLDEYHELTRDKVLAPSLLPLSDIAGSTFANKCLICLECLVGGSNILALRLQSDGVLIMGSTGGMLTTLVLPVPLPHDTSSIKNLPSQTTLHSAALITIDCHPFKQSLMLTGSMDRKVCLVQLTNSEPSVLQSFDHHRKFVVRVRWSPSGNCFATASYDQSICIYRGNENDKYVLKKQMRFNGQVEAITFRQTTDVLITAIRNDHKLHIIDMTEDEPNEIKAINMNALGDDYVSFTAMDISCCPSDKFILVSTDKNRLIIYDLENGSQIANFYGSLNDEYSQPRSCWHPSGHYIYSTSQDKSIVVWEVTSQGVVAKLQGHTGMVRDLWYCEPLSVLASCGFDGTVRLWHSAVEQTE